MHLNTTVTYNGEPYGVYCTTSAAAHAADNYAEPTHGVTHYEVVQLLRRARYKVNSLVLRKQTPLHLDMNPLRVELMLFEDESDYERVANSIVARIRSGEIKPCEPEEDEE